MLWDWHDELRERSMERIRRRAALDAAAFFDAVAEQRRQAWAAWEATRPRPAVDTEPSAIASSQAMADAIEAVREAYLRANAVIVKPLLPPLVLRSKRA